MLFPRAKKEFTFAAVALFNTYYGSVQSNFDHRINSEDNTGLILVNKIYETRTK